MAKWSSEYETVDIEADDATLGSDWTVPEDTKASNGRYVSIKPGLNSTNAALSKRENVITIPFSVSQDAKNYIDARANFPSADDDSFWMKTDEGDYMPADGTCQPTGRARSVGIGCNCRPGN